jgi:hypothetical protein
MVTGRLFDREISDCLPTSITYNYRMTVEFAVDFTVVTLTTVLGPIAFEISQRVVDEFGIFNPIQKFLFS